MANATSRSRRALKAPVSTLQSRQSLTQWQLEAYLLARETLRRLRNPKFVATSLAAEPERRDHDSG